MSKYSKKLRECRVYKQVVVKVKAEFLESEFNLETSYPKDSVTQRITKKLAEEQRKEKFSGTTSLMTEITWKDVNDKRIKEQVLDMVNTKLATHDGKLDQLSQTLTDFSNRKKKQSENLDEWFKQHVKLPGISFSQWLTLIFKTKIPKIHKYYSKLLVAISEDKIQELPTKSLLDGFGSAIIDVEDSINYDTENNVLVVVHDKVAIIFSFKSLKLSVNSQQTPGFSILHDRWIDSGFCEERIVKSKDVKQLVYDLKIKVEDEVDVYAKKVSEYLNIEANDYLELLNDVNRNIFIDEDNGKMSMHNIVNRRNTKEKKLKWRLRNVPLKAYFCIDGAIFNNYSKVDPGFLFLMNINNTTFEQYALKNKHIPIVHDLLCLYMALNSFGQPIQVLRTVQEDIELHDVQILKGETINLKDHYLYKNELDFDDHVLDTAFFGFSNQDKSKKNEKKESNVDVEDLIAKRYVKILIHNKPRHDYLIQKMKTCKLSNKEIRFLSQFYSYPNKVGFQTPNIRVRGILNVINSQRGRNLLFLDVVSARYGGSANILCCLFKFFNCVRLSNAGVSLLNDFDVFYIKDAYWINHTKEMSKIVKERTVYNGQPFSINDFKNLQYLDNFIGPLGSDGKTVLESISQRVYVQHSKMILKSFGFDSELDSFELADLLAEMVFEHYWRLVFKQTKKKFKGYVKNIKIRDSYSTDSGSGGVKGQFRGKEILDVTEHSGMIFERASDNKRSSFNAEDAFWYMKTIFDIPATICDMILKRKENGKLRYIYAVYMPHYIMNTMATKFLEDDMNQLGVVSLLDETNVFFHNFKKTTNLFNCIDYSEFNDQHECKHKQLIWSTLQKVNSELSQTPEFNDEFSLICDWLCMSCESMFLRLESDNSVLYEHKGRLFSGERSTTLINSLMSVFYFSLITINTFIVRQDEFPETILTVYKMFKEKELSICQILLLRLSQSECLGDDGRAEVLKIEDAAFFNELAIFSGLMLKLNKCLIGVGVSEFLRKLEIKDENSITITKGYVCRAIASLVCGNPEGSGVKNYTAQIQQIYESLQLIRIRSGVNRLTDQILEDSWAWISKLNTKNREKNNKSLPVEILYMTKEQGGMGFVNSNGEIFVNKKTFRKMPQPGQEKTYDLKTFHANANETKVQMEDLQGVLKYGTVNPRGVQRRQTQDKIAYIQSNNQAEQLYGEYFLEVFEKYSKDVIANIDGEYVKFESIELENFDYSNFFENVGIVNRTFGVKAYNTKVSVTDLIKRVDALKGNLQMVNVSETFEDIAKSSFGEFSYHVWNISKKYFHHSMYNTFIEPSIYNNVLSHFYFLFRKKYSLDYVRVFMHEYFKLSDKSVH